MKLREIIKDLDIIDVSADMDAEITGVSYDSRRSEPGDLFVAIKGFESDGHRFISKALERGVVAVLCEDAPEGDVPCVRVRDSRRGLALASCRFFGEPAKELCVIGFTGTSGKTSSSYIMKHLLEAKLDAKVGLI